MSKLNKDSTIKCDNRRRCLFFNCNYSGIPTTKLPWLLRFLSPDNTFLPSSYLRLSKAHWKRLSTTENYFCPKCGKHMTDKNLAENFEEIVQSPYYRIFVFGFLASILFLIYHIYLLATQQYFVDWKMLYYFAACLASFCLMLMLKR